MSAKSRVVVDEREKASGVPDLLRELGLMVDYRMLEVGDYIVAGYAVERKEARDFLRSLFSQRIFDQAHRLSEMYENPVLVVEGEVAALTNREIKPRAYWGALAALTFDYGLRVFFSPNVAQTANLVYTLTRRKPLVFKGPIVKKKRKVDETEKMQLQIVSTLPGIGLKLADRLLGALGSIRKVFTASAAELSTVRGVGKTKANKIRSLLDATYHPSLERPQQLRLDDSAPKDLKA